MQVTKFNEKLNCLENNIYTIEEVLSPVDGVIDVALKHDNVIKDSVNVYTGSRLTGDKINTYVLSTPSATPWRTLIKIYTNLDKVYVTYETKGDTVEAEDVNGLQSALNETQTALNAECDRATTAEENINNKLSAEINRATNRENTIESNLNKEITRATSAEKVITDNLNAEITRSTNKDNEIVKNLNNEISRATSVESTLNNNLNAEIQRATTKENSLSNSLDAEIKRATAKESAIDTELSKRYTKDQVYTKDEVLTKINDLINNAPDVLDTFGEIAKALGNDPNFATTMTTMLSQKVDKISGKGLSTNDFDNTQKSNLEDCNNKKHVHDNKSILDGITSTLVTNWNNAFNHISDAIKHITSAERSLWNTVSNKLDKSGGTITGNIVKTGGGAGLIISKSSTSKTMMYASNTEGEHLFGGNNSGTDVVEDYVRVGKNLLQYTTGSNSYKVYHQGNKPTPSEIGASTSSHTHNINEMEVENFFGGNDLNTYNTEKMWSVRTSNTTSNRPGDYYTVLNVGAKGYSNFQLAHNYGNFSNFYVRGRHDATANYTPWAMVYTTQNKPKLSELTNDTGFITRNEVDTSQNHTHANKGVLDKITQNDVDKIQNLEIGSRNLLLNSNLYNEIKSWGGSHQSSIVKITETQKEISFPKTFNSCIKNTSNSSQTYGFTTQYVELLPSTTYTVSFWMYVPNATTGNVGIYVYYDNGGWQGLGGKTTSVRDKWVKISYTFKSNSTYTNTIIAVGVNNGKGITYSALGKVEQGNVATDWTPAPEDMVQKGCTWNDLRGV